MQQVNKKYRGSPTSTVSTSTIFTSTNFIAIGIKLVLVEFRIVRFFQNPKNRTKRGPPVLSKKIKEFDDEKHSHLLLHLISLIWEHSHMYIHSV